MTPRHGDAPTGGAPWRRRLYDLARSGTRQQLARDVPGLGPYASGYRVDGTVLDLRRRPRQGRLGDCWVMASLLAVHDRAPHLLEERLVPQDDGAHLVRLAAAEVRVDRRMPVDAQGRWVYATQSGQGPGWAGLFEKAVALHVAGSYGTVARGFGRFGLGALLPVRVRTHLLIPRPARLKELIGLGCAVVASTHPASPLVRGPHGRLPANHVMALVGADAERDEVQLRNPWRPDELLTLPWREFRRGFLSIDVSAPLR